MLKCLGVKCPHTCRLLSIGSAERKRAGGGQNEYKCGQLATICEPTSKIYKCL